MFPVHGHKRRANVTRLKSVEPTQELVWLMMTDVSKNISLSRKSILTACQTKSFVLGGPGSAKYRAQRPQTCLQWLVASCEGTSSSPSLPKFHSLCVLLMSICHLCHHLTKRWLDNVSLYVTPHFHISFLLPSLLLFCRCLK